MNITARMERLEDEVQHLKTWAGPGQIQALVEGQRAIRAELAKANTKLDRHERILIKITKTLDQHGERLDQHGEALARHDERFTGIEQRLDRHDARFTGIEEMLAELLRRVPEPPSTN